MTWYEAWGWTFVVGVMAIVAVVAIILFTDVDGRKLWVGLLTGFAIAISGAIGMTITREPTTVEQLDNTKCSMYVWNGKWDCVPWDQAG